VGDGFAGDQATNFSYLPDRYEYNCLGTSNSFRFRTYKVKGQGMKMLENSNNPFAVVIQTVLIALQKSKKEPEDMMSLSLESRQAFIA
jgi:hypothetical protein